MCVLTLSVGTVKATDWMSIASTPTTGDFYIFNLQKGMFLYYNQWENKFQVTADPYEVTLFSLTVGETYSTISCSFYDWETEQDVTKYMAKVGSYVAPSDDSFNLKIEASATQEGASRIWIWKKTSGLVGKGDKYLDVYNSLTNNDVCYSGLPGYGTNWIFITEENFSTLEPPHHYAQIQYPGDNDKHGAYAAVVDYDANWNPIYEYHYTLPNTDLEVGNFKESYTHQFNEVQSIPARGYQFVSWSLMGANAEYSVNPYLDVTYTATTNPTQINVTSSSDDAEHPEVATIQPNFDVLDPLTITVQQAAGRGYVTVQYTNYLDNDAHNGLEYKTITCDEVLTSAEKEKSYNTMYSSDLITLTATPEAGYSFFGWYSVDGSGHKTLVSEEASYEFMPYADETYYAYFNRPVTAADKFKVGFSLCESLEQALAAVTEDDKTILLLNDYTVPAGNYSIPAGVTLLIPHSASQTTEESSITREPSNELPTGAYLTLTLAANANLDVYGTIEVGGTQYVGGDINYKEDPWTDGFTNGSSRPGEYGQLVMSSNSSIILNNGAILRAWGYVTGSGEIDARRGATAYEQFQVMDWKGGSNTENLINNATTKKVFPLNQYFIQNIETPTKYRPGSRLYTAVGIYIPSYNVIAASDGAQIIGISNRNDGEDDDIAMFLMDDNDDSADSWVRKSYDVMNDKQLYEVNNSAHLGSITIDLSAWFVDYTMESKQYNLPITNNMKIHLLSGNMDITQNTVLLPGSEMEINKESTVTINEGQALYLYDTDQWDKYAHSGAYAKQVSYRPGGVPARDVTTKEALGDAALNIHGTFEVDGALYTTEGGANIYSNIEDAGTVMFKTDAGAGADVYQWKNTGAKYFAAACTSAQLKNENGTLQPTAGTEATEDDPISFCFIDFDDNGNGEWKSLSTEGCFVKDEKNVYYIKPQEYVAISQGAQPVEETDHTYRDHYAGTDRIFILGAEGNCQWWEVQAVPGRSDIFECINENNHTFYYYDESAGNWMEKKFKVSWVNWNGDPVNYINDKSESVNYYMVTYGTVPQWLSANPTHTEDDSHTYSFSGWLPTPSAVTEDVTYTAQYEERDRMYAITFNDENDELIELVYCKLGTMPECSRYDAAANNKEWTPTIGLVTNNGNHTYKLKAQESKSSYTVTWLNWNGDPIRTDADKTTMLDKPADPSKADDVLHSYTFAGWSPEPLAAGTTLTADAVYTATYTPGPRSYTIRFLDVDGETELSSTSLAYGAQPTLPDPLPTKAATAEKTYTLVWSPLVGAVTGAQDYIATFTEATRQYRVDWKANGAIIETKYFDYGATPVYSGVTPAQASTAEYAYNFTGWDHDYETVESDQEYVAQFAAVQLNMNVTEAQTINSAVSVQTITIGTTGTLTANPGAVITADELILESDGSSASGQLITSSMVNVPNVHFDLKLNAKNHQWYAVAVPWQVNAETGISVNGRTLTLGTDFDIIYYNGERRASEGKQKCWNYVEDDGDKTLVPGRLYMIGLMGDASTIRFTKSSGALLTTSTSVTAHPSDVAADKGWNGVANPALFHAFVNPGVTYGQVYKSDTRDYDPITLSEAKFVVGQGAFVSVDADKAITVNKDAPFSPASAPRSTRTSNVKYEVRLAPAEANYTSRLYIETTDDKEADEYIVGQDLAKIGVSSIVPQMWINRYDAKLCVNTAELTNETAEYPLGISVPANGEYTIRIQDSEVSDQYSVYLTLNNEAIWNLSDAPYTLDLTKGTTNAYGLRISAKAPQVVTGVDEAVVDAKGETRKVLINNQVFIIRGNQVYSIDGQLIR